MNMRLVTLCLVCACFAIPAAPQAAPMAAKGQASQKASVVPKLLKDGAYAGEIRAFAGEVCPVGWLPADGNTYNDPNIRFLGP